MLNHPLASVTHGARWRQEDLLEEAARERRLAPGTKLRVRWGLIALALLMALWGSRGGQ
ncbi:MAG: hypothetical protein KC442_09425 [Thermomicrobiales bacterium]|nr:hypothetical protein [Thermomicrobiales bacterium]